MAETPLDSATPRRGLLDPALSLRWSVPLLAVLLAFPLLAPLVGGDFYLGLAARILIFALAATSLNLILGFGGMVSFGHAAFIGVGAYTVGCWHRLASIPPGSSGLPPCWWRRCLRE